MLKNLTIQGFKSIANVENLSLGQVNVFVGANGSGKSNLLEAVGVLGAALTGIISNQTLNSRGVRLSPANIYTTSLSHVEAYPPNSQPLTYPSVRFEAATEWKGSKVNYRAVVRPMLMPSDIWYFEEQYRSPEQELKDEVAQMKDYLTDFALFTPTTPVLRGIQPDVLARDPVGLLGGRLAEAINDLLSEESNKIGHLDLDDVLDLLDWVENFDITTPSQSLLSADVPSLRSIIRFKDYWMNNPLSGYDASEGALYVLFILVLALHPRAPYFFALDNFDQALNPRLARGLTRLLCQIILESEQSRQVLLTTHNPQVLDGLDLRDDRIRLFVVERNHQTKGATTVRRILLTEKMKRNGQNGLALSDMWVTGLLGGVPNIF